MNSIKNTFIDEDNILLVDNENKLWIMGDNYDRKTGFGKKNKPLYTPIYCGITLDKNEQVSKFYSYDSMLCIYTSSKKLFVSKTKENKTEKCETRTSQQNEIVYYSVDSSDSGSSESSESYDVKEFRRKIEDDVQDSEINSDDVSDIGTNSDDASDTRSWEDDFEQSCFSIYNEIDTNYSNKIFNNNKFFWNIITKEKLRKQDTSQGFYLLEEDVEDVIFLAKCIFFKKNNIIYFFNKENTGEDIIVHRTMFFSFIQIKKKNIYYYQLNLPFPVSEKVIFCQNYIYIYIRVYSIILFQSLMET